jgi:branched-chain amino acid aminotransferase
MKISITLAKKRKAKPDSSTLKFGHYFTDHMFIMEYTEERGWFDARIVPYGPLSIEPSCKVLHYGQEIFEGLKAYRHADGRAVLFRPEKNFRRLNLSAERMCMSKFDEAFALLATRKLIEIDADWIPSEPGTSLYVRPFIFASDNLLGIGPSTHYTFMVICSPVGPYFGGALKPVKIAVETEHVRSVRGATGEAKTGGNYAGSLAATVKAQKEGFSQVLWLDGVERRFIEEVGAMNIFFVIDGEVITPALEGSILDGITRMSCIEVLRARGYTVTERRICIDELQQHMRAGRLSEIFGSGTAAVISPIGGLQIGSHYWEINGGECGPVTEMLYNTITGIQTGVVEDEFGWVVRV